MKPRVLYNHGMAIKFNEALIKHGQTWLHFQNPHVIFQATQMDEVRPMLRETERLVNEKGWYAAGFVSYEASPAFDSAQRVISSSFPLLWFGLYSAPNELADVFAEIYSLPALGWQPEITQNLYNNAIKRIKENIALGNTYQVNYTMRLRADFSPPSAWDLFTHLAFGQNKYAAYLDIGRYAICSASPELFFRLNGGALFSRPMKGTVKRGRTTAEDEEKSAWLFQSVKNRAENVMIVDMIRNDIGRIAEIGSVRVPELFAVEKYPTLFQMTSTVQGKTKAGVAEIFDALFPCASITGAPKVSTMNIIARLESSPRKLYTGSIGFIAPQRKAQFNVAIRTALVDFDSRSAEYGIGGGVVWDSTSADEYGEALLKARALTESPREFSLLETILWTPEDGYFLRNEHLARMQDSAKYFGFSFLQKSCELYLDAISKYWTRPMRVRILLNKAGEFSHHAVDAPQSNIPFTARLAEKPIDSNDAFFFHKTTYREIYPKPEGCDDLLLFNENNELTEFTIGNLVVEMDGGRYTPPARCGLLAGVFRAYLLRAGEIQERVLYPRDLSRCSNIFLINSVRKWVKVNLL